jgi:phosphoribosylformylglycinamidine cyclo-ligase
MGCGFCAVVPDADADAAVALLDRHHPGTRRIGTVTADTDRITVPALGIAGGPGGLAAG